MKTTLTLSLLLLLAACSSAKLLAPTQADVDRGAAKYPGYTLAEMNQGKALFEANCNRCHGLKEPSSRDEAQWNKIVPRMVTKVNNKVGPNTIDAAGQEKVLKYLVTMSMAPKAAN